MKDEAAASQQNGLPAHLLLFLLTTALSTQTVKPAA